MNKSEVFAADESKSDIEQNEMAKFEAADKKDYSEYIQYVLTEINKENEADNALDQYF